MYYLVDRLLNEMWSSMKIIPHLLYNIHEVRVCMGTPTILNRGKYKLWSILLLLSEFGSVYICKRTFVHSLICMTSHTELWGFKSSFHSKLSLIPQHTETFFLQLQDWNLQYTFGYLIWTLKSKFKIPMYLWAWIQILHSYSSFYFHRYQSLHT